MLTDQPTGEELCYTPSASRTKATTPFYAHLKANLSPKHPVAHHCQTSPNLGKEAVSALQENSTPTLQRASKSASIATLCHNHCQTTADTALAVWCSVLQHSCQTASLDPLLHCPADSRQVSRRLPGLVLCCAVLCCHSSDCSIH
jgi:hypothetical protein